MEPRVDRVLVLSTAHIPAEAAAKLNNPLAVESPDGWSGWPYEYGWLIWVPNPKDHDDNYVAAEPWLKAIYDFAIEHSCSYIRFDADEPELVQLSTYDWDEAKNVAG